MTQSPDDAFAPTLRTELHRVARRAVYDRERIYEILDEALVCHVGFLDQGQPFVIPTIAARVGDALFLHGSRASRMLRLLSSGAPACVTVTLLDGLVLARSAFHHSMNYRSVVILGVGREVTDGEEKLAALRAISEHVLPGRWDAVRLPTEQELAATTVVFFPLEEVSAKVRSGPPADDEADYALPIWAGVIPLTLRAGLPEPDSRLAPGVPVPRHVQQYDSPGRPRTSGR